MQEMNNVPQRKQRRRRWTAGRIIGLTFLVVLLLAVAGLAWTGLVPGLSHVAGADRPRDLGVRATQADYDQAMQQLDAAFGNRAPASGTAAPAKGNAKAVPKQVELDLTNSQLSALLAQHEQDAWPLINPQVRVHTGGAIEISAGINTTDIPLDEIPDNFFRQVVAGLPDVVPVYMKGNIFLGSPTELSVTIERLEVGRMPLPSSVRDSLNAELARGLTEGLIKSDSGVTLQELRCDEGILHLKVIVPA